ncbi:MAG: alpha/beta fold hydrolase, partial [Cytophagales bacterium]
KLVSIKMQLYYKEIGFGEPIIILHGLFGSSDNWLTFSKKLSEKGYRVILVDLRNHGRSPHDSIHNYDEMANDIKELIDRLELKQPTIMGHSMGGKAAMKFSVKYPDSISKLVVVDIGPKYYKPHHHKYLAALNAIPVSKLSSRTEAEAVIAPLIEDFGERQFLLKNLARKEDGGFEWKMNLKVLEDQIDNIGEGMDANQKFRKPTLFVKGSKSNYIKDDDAIMMKWIFPLSNLVEVENSGHWVHVDQPDKLLEVVSEFLKNQH